MHPDLPDPGVKVAWSGFDLINGFNAWKKTEDAGRVVAIDTTGEAEIVVTGLPWRFEVCQQVFEEAAVDYGRALAAWWDSRCGKRTGKRVGFPCFKKKTGVTPSFRLRNKHPKGRTPAIRVGDNGRPRSITLPGFIVQPRPKLVERTNGAQTTATASTATTNSRTTLTKAA